MIAIKVWLEIWPFYLNNRLIDFIIIRLFSLCKLLSRQIKKTDKCEKSVLRQNIFLRVKSGYIW